MYVGVCFFKQKTAYEMRIRDWSSDVRSSDLLLGHGLCVHQRPDIGIVDAAADRQRRGLPGEAAAEFAVDGALNVEAVGAQAVLPGGGELRLHRLVHGAAEVGVGKDDEGGVAAELQAQALDARRALRIEQPDDLR